MVTQIGPLAVRRSIWIDAPPARVWQEFEDLEHMQRWFGTGHTLVKYEAHVGAEVETNAGELDGEALRFVGRVTVCDAPRELTFEQDWVGHGWKAPPLVTIRLTPLDAGTLVELFHHGFEVLGADAAENHRGFEGGWTMMQLEALHEPLVRDRVFGALADPTRRAILDLLREHASLTAGEIAARFPAISRPAVSKHLRVLRAANLVRAAEQGRENHYTLDAAPLGELQREWLDLFAPYWQRSLERLKVAAEAPPTGRGATKQGGRRRA